jgi:AraC family transcriptional regulator
LRSSRSKSETALKSEGQTTVTSEEIHPRISAGLVKIDAFSKSWSGVDVIYHEKYLAPGICYSDMTSERARIIVCLDLRGGICEPRWKLDEPTPQGRCEPGYFIWIPPRQTIWGYADGCQFIRDVTLEFDIEHAVELVGDHVHAESLKTPLLQVYDSRVTQCAQLLANACVDPFDNDQSFGEGLVTAFLSAFVNASTKEIRSERPSGLAPWQLRLAVRYLEEHLTEEISLSELASLTRLSGSRFARAFKASTGLPPYTWLLKQRIDKAKELLAADSEPLASIAIRLGFADQSHFGKAFRRFAGSTPRAWQLTRISSRPAGTSKDG